MTSSSTASNPNEQTAGSAPTVSHVDHPRHQQHPPRPPSVAGSHPAPQQSQHQLPPRQQSMPDSNKRAALAGQWRTPPLPVFPTSVSSNQAPPPHHQQHHPPPSHHSQQQSQQPPQPQPANQQPGAVMPPPSVLPHNSEDYAKALQEAYRRGAEAAAAMAAQQQHMSPSTSCPNFQRAMTPAPPPQQRPPHGQTIMASRSEDMTASSTAYSHSHAPPPPQTHPGYHYPPPAPHPSHTQHTSNTAHLHTQHAAHSTPRHAQHPPPSGPPPRQYAATHAQQYAAPVATAQNTTAAPAATSQPMAPPPPATPAAVPNPLSNMPPPPNKQPPPLATQPPPPVPQTTAPGTAQIVVPPPQQRSVSLPDMTSFAVQAEEEKRQKRLARNRASARLRRLRKKNLVDAYETEVGILEKTLQQLKAHEWGVPASGHAGATASASNEKSHQSLLEALCMDRGQQVISSEQRAQQCQDILEQQLQQMELLRQVQFEQQLLAAASSSENKDDDPELVEMAAELNQVLGLSCDQKAKMQESTKGLDDEMTALDTVFSSLVMMKENEWLLNQGVQDITDQLTSILHKNQMSKFLLWADANVEAIDQLDHVHAAPKTAPHPQGPIFTFGVETTPMEDEGDGK